MKAIVEILNVQELRFSVPVRFAYRGFTVRRTSEVRGSPCYWLATREGSEKNPLISTLPTQVVGKIDEHLKAMAM